MVRYQACLDSQARAPWFCQLGLAPFDHLLRNTCKGHQLESKRSSLLLQTNELAVVGPSFHNREDALIIRLPRRDDVAENSSELVSGSRNGRRSTEPGSQAAEVVPQVRLAAVKRLRRHAESHGQAMNHLARAHGEDLAGTNPVIRTEAHKAAAWGKLWRSGPTSDHKVWAVKLFTPGTAVRSAPKIRYR